MAHFSGSTRKRRNIVSHATRRRCPHLYPEVCTICIPERRFRLPAHHSQHDKDKHGYSPQVTLESVRNSFSGLHICPQRLNVVSRPISIPATSLDQRMSQGEFNKYVDTNVVPDFRFNAHCNAAVFKLAHFLQNNVPYELRPQEVIKAGSLGKGTAVKNKSDADLVVFLSNTRYNSVEKMIDMMPDVLNSLRHYLKEYGQCEITGQTQFAVKVKLSCHTGYYLDVDILPTVNILECKEPEDVFTEMKYKSEDQRRYYSAPLVKLQRDFVKSRTSSSTKLKNVICTVKYWRKTASEESSSRRLPSSYPLELITIGLWESMGRPSNFDLRKGFYSVLQALTNYRGLRRRWTDNYQHFELPAGPYVMDPANPFNNVMDASDSWDEVAERAERTISSAFDYLYGNISWQ